MVRLRKLGSVAVLSLLLAACAGASGAPPAGEQAGAEPQVADALLELKVKLALLEHLRDDALRIQARVAGGVAWLSGTVDERASYELVAEVARAVEGVKEVRNEVRLEATKTDTPLSAGVAEGEREVRDGLLEARVKARLFEAVGRSAFGIEVEAAQGVVTLSGLAPDRDSRRLAVRAAKKTKGVRRVEDLLRLRAE